VSPVARALVGYAVAFAAVVLASGAAGLVLLELDPAAVAGTQLPALLAGGLASAGALTVVALVAGRRSPRVELALVRPRSSPGALLGMVVGTLALGQALESLAYLLGFGAVGTPEVIRQALAGVTVGRLAVAVVVIGGFAGFAEELFFRGFMQTQLRAEWRPAWAITVTGVGFGALHLDWVHAALALVLGIYLGVVREVSGSTLAAVLCHVVNNAVSVVATGVSAVPSGPAVHALVLGSAVLVFLLSLLTVRSAARRSRRAASVRGTDPIGIG
jgi:membrane protease YdiL (CAAX protease family)